MLGTAVAIPTSSGVSPLLAFIISFPHSGTMRARTDQPMTLLACVALGLVLMARIPAQVRSRDLFMVRTRANGPASRGRNSWHVRDVEQPCAVE